jgi:hypothetical protein
MHHEELMQLSDLQALIESLRAVAKTIFDADRLVHELYNKAWLGKFRQRDMMRSEEIHRTAASAEAARRAERKAQSDKARAAASPSARASTMAGGGGGADGEAGGGGGEPTSEEMVELVAARMQRMSGVLDYDSDADAGADAADDEDLWEEVVALDSPERGHASPGAAAGSAPGVVDVSDGAAGEGGGGGGGGGGAEEGAWEPAGYLLKKSPSVFKVAWQRRWFKVTSDGDFCWYPSSRADASGSEPLGRVPLSMVVSATPASESGCFDVDLGHRKLQLALDGMAKSRHELGVRRWLNALVKHEVVGGTPDGQGSHRRKFWKVKSEGKGMTPPR